MRTAVGLTILLLSSPTAASAIRRCNLDLSPMVSAHFDLVLIDDATIARVRSVGELLVSKGGAVTLMRTDTGDNGRPIRFFVSGQLGQEQLRTLQQALDAAATAAPSDPCLIESFADPGNGHSLYGRSELTLYRGTALTLRLFVIHDDVSTGPTPLCPSETRVLDKVLRALEDRLRGGVHPLQCTPYGSRPD